MATAPWGSAEVKSLGSVMLGKVLVEFLFLSDFANPISSGLERASIVGVDHLRATTPGYEPFQTCEKLVRL